jgi:hypothetical protein
MADVSGKFFSAKKVRTGVSPSSPGVEQGEALPPVNPPGTSLNSVGLTMPSAFAVANSPLTSNGTIAVTGAGTTDQYIRGDGSLQNFPSLTGYVPYTGATADVNLGTHDLTAERGTFANNGSSDTLTVNHTSGSGIGVKVTKGGNNEALLVTKTSGSGNAMAVVGGRTSLVDLSLSSVSNATGNFLTISGGVVHQRTPSETRSDVGAQAQLNGTGFVKASGTTITYDNSTYQVTSEKGQPNGYASLDSNGKVPLTQINDALIGNVNYQGLWNAATNNPTLVNPPSSGTKGYYYIVSTAGTFAGISFEVGDWIISNGSAWQKVDNTDAVSSVFGRTGNVTATNGDYNTSQVTENTNLYFTQARVSANTDVAANTAARHAAVTLGTANGLSLSTQQLSLGLASAGVTGALSGTDWTTFNSKENAITAGTTAQYYRGDKTFQTLNTAAVPELTNLYYTDARSRAAISLTTTGASGSSTYNNTTGVLNVPTYTLSGLGGIGGTIAEGRVAFGTAANTIGGDSGLIYDNTNKRLGVGTLTPLGILNVSGTNAAHGTTGIPPIPTLLLFRSTSSTSNYAGLVIQTEAAGSSFGLYSNQNGVLFYHGDTERWRITSSGVFQSNGAQTIQTSTGNLTLATGGANGNILLTPQGSGKVGIGTVTPDAQLQVSTTDNLIANFQNTRNGATQLFFGNDFNFDATNFTNYSTTLFFRGDKQNRYTSAGVVIGPLASIATIYDNTTFSADSQQGAGALVFSTRQGTATTASDTLTERWRIGSTGILQSNGAQTIQTSTGNLTFATGGGNADININPNGTGKVGVNTATEYAKFQVTANTAITIPALGTTNDSAAFAISTQASTYGLLSGVQSTGNVWMQAQRFTGAADAFNLLLQPSGGNVLIGTTTEAGFRLDVNGTARVQGVLTATADAVVNGVNIGRGGGNLDSNTVIGLSAGINNTTGVANFSGGLFAGQNNTTGSGNIFLGSTAGRLTASGANMTISNNSIFLGSNSRPNAINETNQIVIGQNAIGLGSNTTVLGNTSTTHGRWYGSLLLGTTTNAASSILTMQSTTQGFLPPRMTTTQRNAIASPATGLVVYDTTLNDPFYYNGTAWTMFQDGITLTTTGTSGAATLVGTTINIPQYQAALTNPVTGTGTSGQVAYFNGTSSITGESNLFWDSTNDRLGIGTNIPVAKLDIVGGYIRSGTAASPSGSKILWGNYSDGALTTFGSSFSSGGPVIGYGVSPSTSAEFAFVSSTGITLTRGAYYIAGGNHYWYAGASQTVAVDSAVTMVNTMSLSASGNLATIGGFEIPNGQFYKARRSSGSLLTDMIGIPSGTDDVRLLTTGDFNILNGSLTNLMTVKNGGNVGIGTNSPQVAGGGYTGLHINGSGSSLVLSTSGANLTYLYTLGTGGIDFAIENSGAQIFRPGGSEKMRITSGGNVLIGKTNDRLRLTVSGSDSNAPTLGTASGTAIFANNAESTEYGMNFGVASTGYGWIQQHRFDGTSTVYALALQPSGGNVGIGTTSPTARLGISANAGVDVINVAGYDVLKWDSGDILTFGGYKSGQWNSVVLSTAGSPRLTIDSTGAAIFYSSVKAASFIVNTSGQARTISTFHPSGSAGENIWIGGGGTNSTTGGGASGLGSNNTSLGVFALEDNTTGARNTAIGYLALSENTSGNSNTASGEFSMYKNTTGYINSAYGSTSLAENTTGYGNAAFGMSSLRYITTGDRNTAIGLGSGEYVNSGAENNTSRFSTYLGYDTRASANGNTNEVVIGSEARGQGSNSVVIGNGSITKTILRGDVLIGTETPVTGAMLNVNGNIRTGAPTGTAAENWRLGRALLATSSVAEDTWIRVQLGTKIYDILAIDRGDA